MTKIHMTRPEVMKAGNLLTEHCKPIEGSGGLYLWEQDWNDERIAALMDRKEVNAEHVKRLRIELRMITQQKMISANADLEFRIVELDRVLGNEQRTLEALVDRFNKLISTLSLNRVADVRHLEIKD